MKSFLYIEIIPGPTLPREIRKNVKLWIAHPARHPSTGFGFGTWRAVCCVASDAGAPYSQPVAGSRDASAGHLRGNPC